MADADYVSFPGTPKLQHLPAMLVNWKRWPGELTLGFATQNADEAAELKKKRTFRKFSYRGIDLDQYGYSLRLDFQLPRSFSRRQVPPAHLTHNQTPRPILRTASGCRPRPRSPPVQPWSQAEADGLDQEAAESQASREAEREARPRQDGE